MTVKRLLVRERVRQIPAQFSWLDHRLVRDRHIERCDAPACALYLFLVTVADAQGLSYYSEGSIAKRLSMDFVRLSQARSDLVRFGLIAYEPPLYQVLALDRPFMPTPTREISPQHWRERLAQARARTQKRP